MCRPPAASLPLSSHKATKRRACYIYIPQTFNLSIDGGPAAGPPFMAPTPHRTRVRPSPSKSKSPRRRVCAAGFDSDNDEAPPARYHVSVRSAKVRYRLVIAAVVHNGSSGEPRRGGRVAEETRGGKRVCL